MERSGTWGSLHEKLPLDGSGNGTAGSISRHRSQRQRHRQRRGQVQKADRLRGLDNFIVVDTADALLICPKADEQWIKQLVTQMKAGKQK